jgi:thioredoxin-like negative regulator of GroEL
VPLSDSLASSFERLELAFRNGDSSADLACWLIGGYIATGQKDAARDVAGHPRFEQATDWRFAVLKALVAYMHGDSGESERLLRGVVASDPDNPVALIDLAIVLSEEGRGDEARAILARVSEAHAGTPLATRAVTIASRIEGP